MLTLFLTDRACLEWGPTSIALNPRLPYSGVGVTACIHVSGKSSPSQKVDACALVHKVCRSFEIAGVEAEYLEESEGKLYYLEGERAGKPFYEGGPTQAQAEEAQEEEEEEAQKEVPKKKAKRK